MHFTASTLFCTVLLASSAIAGPVAVRDNDKNKVDSHDMDDSYDIFKHSAER